ncbi:MAG: EcsC family protein [Flavisolibacter sp.]|nr:EcsC family protein [Flavisolibacter sp.]
MAKKLNQEVIIKGLEWAYDKALSGGVLDTAYDLAHDYLQKSKNKEEAISSLINWQTAKCATSGFITGCGGLITLPVTVPANLVSVLFMQLRMIVAIAIISGYDPKSDPVRSLAYVCLTGNAASNVLKGVGIKMGEMITEKAIEEISGRLMAKINQIVGARLLTRFGKTGVVNLGKAIPIAGGIISGTFDAAATKIIGTIATRVFYPGDVSSRYEPVL